MSEYETTVGELRRALSGYPDDYELCFGPHPGLTFYRAKQRGDKLVQLEFNELDYRDGKWRFLDPKDFVALDPNDPNRERYTGQPEK